MSVAQYNIAFAERLAETAQMVAAQGLEALDAQRTVLYLSLLSMEIAMKAMLERAGIPIAEIRGRSHRLSELLIDLSGCEIRLDVAGSEQYVPASRLRACPLVLGSAESTVGTVIDAERQGASKYPNQVRYGDLLHHFPADVVSGAALETARFAREHWDSLRVKSGTRHPP